MDAESTNNAEFIKATKDVRDLTAKPSNEQLLTLYSLFKQSVFGDNETERPGMFDFTAKYKYDAWLALKGVSKEEAQKRYIQVVQGLMSA